MGESEQVEIRYDGLRTPGDIKICLNAAIKVHMPTPKLYEN
jgi:hypothetical protein